RADTRQRQSAAATGPRRWSSPAASLSTSVWSARPRTGSLLPVIDMRDRVTARLLDAEATAPLAAAGYDVSVAWRGSFDVPWFDRNWRNPSISAFDAQRSTPCASS